MAALMASLSSVGASSGGRGLAFDSVAYASRPNLIDRVVITEFVAMTPVVPGQDTVLTLAVPDLARNAEVKSLTCELYVSDGSAGAPTPTSTSIKGPDDAKAKDYVISVAAPTRPRNVALRLDGGDVFWRKGDELTEMKYDLPDIAPQVNAFLDRLSPGGDVALRFLMTSDTPGRATIKLKAKSASRIQTQAWSNPVDGAKSVERSITLAFGDVIDLDLTPLPADGSAGTVRTMSVNATGVFGPERTLGSAELAPNVVEYATAGGDYSVAQAFTVPVNVECTGVIVAVATAAATTLYFALMADLDGAPQVDAPALAEAQVNLDAASGGDAMWQYAKWPTPIVLSAQQVVWILCRGIQGAATLPVAALHDPMLGALRGSRGGQQWRSLTEGDADMGCVYARLVYLPGPENPSSPVELAVFAAQSGAEILSVPVDAGAQSQTVRLAMPGTGVAHGIRARVRANGQGVLTVSNVIQEYE